MSDEVLLDSDGNPINVRSRSKIVAPHSHQVREDPKKLREMLESPAALEEAVQIRLDERQKQERALVHASARYRRDPVYREYVRLREDYEDRGTMVDFGTGLRKFIEMYPKGFDPSREIELKVWVLNTEEYNPHRRDNIDDIRLPYVTWFTAIGVYKNFLVPSYPGDLEQHVNQNPTEVRSGPGTVGGK